MKSWQAIVSYEDRVLMVFSVMALNKLAAEKEAESVARRTYKGTIDIEVSEEC